MSGVRIAVLDMDGTLLPGTLGADLLRRAAVTGVGDAQAIARALATIRRYADGEMDLENAVKTVYRLYAQAMAGVPCDAALLLARHVWNEASRTVFPFTAPLITLLHEKGFRTVLISGSPHEIIQLAATDLGIDTALGTQRATRNGRPTGALRYAPALADGKRAALLALTAGWELDLRGSLAIGNSPSDAQIFEMVGTAIAFEPRDGLCSTAAARGWPIADRTDLLDLCTERIHGDSGAPRRLKPPSA
ncbi:haloacid dehalogenase-like hydrolase [Streptomyces sp. NPDC004667]|uniref:HAD family hydrolase n=1 Tax=Streptomyces sp. NPDC004667 TaxID=3154285 RepID=UPI0033A3CED8